jgi:hypothetical protein
LEFAMSAVKEIHAYDDKLVFECEERFDGLVDRCKERQNTRQFGDSELPLLAEVPGIVIYDYCIRNGVTWREFMTEPAHARRMLNDPALAYFRIKPGVV